MTQQLRKEDVRDLDFVDAPELASDGFSSFLSSVTVVSTTASTRRVVVSGVYLVNDPDQRIEPGDKLTLSGTTGGADGVYTVDSVVDDVTLVVVETITDSTGGSASFTWPPGALRVGFDHTGLTHTTAHTVQEAISDLDVAITSGGLTEAQHKALRQLIHFIDDGPADGFASGAYREVTGTIFPSSIIWYDSSGVGKKKIVERLLTWTGVNLTTDVWKMYDAAETLLITVTDTISYSGSFETTRTRTIV